MNRGIVRLVPNSSGSAYVSAGLSNAVGQTFLTANSYFGDDSEVGIIQVLALELSQSSEYVHGRPSDAAFFHALLEPRIIL